MVNVVFREGGETMNNEKPIILVCGAPHSYTSFVSKFLLDNGGYCSDIWDDMGRTIVPYAHYESKATQEYVIARQALKKADLKPSFDSLPVDRVVTLKSPLMAFFADELDQFTDREIRMVYVFRNPQDTILSSIEKTGHEFVYYFNRICWLYSFMANSKHAVFPVVAERLLMRDEVAAKSLLGFCGLPVDSVDFGSIEGKYVVRRKPTYTGYRFTNFIWKRLAFLFRVYGGGR